MFRIREFISGSRFYKKQRDRWIKYLLKIRNLQYLYVGSNLYYKWHKSSFVFLVNISMTFVSNFRLESLAPLLEPFPPSKTWTYPRKSRTSNCPTFPTFSRANSICLKTAKKNFVISNCVSCVCMVVIKNVHL